MNHTPSATIRRLYFYAVALVSLLAGLSSLSGLLDILSDIWLTNTTIYDVNNNDFVRNLIARNGGVLLVAAPIFLIHWGYMQRRLPEPGEASAGLRKFFLYLASAVAVGYAIINGLQMLSEAIRIVLGVPLSQTLLWPSRWFFWAAMAILATYLRLYFHHVLIQDGDWGQEQDMAGAFRRLYQAVLGVVGLALAIFGAGSALEFLWYVDADSWQQPVASGVAMLLLGSLVWRLNWRRWLAITVTHPPEAQTALRRFYLYASVVLSALVTLVPVASVLRETLLQWFGIGEASTSSLAYVPASLLAWWWHWRYLNQEADRYGESPESATVRRLYYYLVAATGLVLMWLGIVDLLQGLLDWVLVGGAGGSGDIRPRLLANGFSLLAVGAPIWALHWRSVESVARRIGSGGESERASGPRRAYLYGVALAGALLILFELGTVVYRLLLVLLGDPNVDLLSLETLGNVVRSSVAAVFWAIHLWAIRQDARMDTAKPDASPPSQDFDLEHRRSALQAQIQGLEEELAEARIELAELESTQQP